MLAELPPEEPSGFDPEWEAPGDESDSKFPEMPCTEEGDAPWEVFLPDDDEWDLVSEPGNFSANSSVAAAY